MCSRRRSLVILRREAAGLAVLSNDAATPRGEKRSQGISAAPVPLALRHLSGVRLARSGGLGCVSDSSLHLYSSDVLCLPSFCLIVSGCLWLIRSLFISLVCWFSFLPSSSYSLSCFWLISLVVVWRRRGGEGGGGEGDDGGGSGGSEGGGGVGGGGGGGSVTGSGRGGGDGFRGGEGSGGRYGITAGWAAVGTASRRAGRR